MHRVMIHPASYDNCRDAVDRAFEIFPQEIAQKKVVIKPNVLRASTAEEHIVTHPPLLRAVVEKIEEMSPAELVVGDNPGLFNYGDNEDSFEKTGLMAAAKGYYRNLGNTTQHVAFNPDFMPEVGISKEIWDADIIISLPKFKTHGLTVMTGAIKNSYGILPGAQKARLHQIAGTPERFHDVIVEVFRLRFLQKAKAMGLGEFDSQMVQIEGKMRILSDFKLPPLGGEAIFGNPEIQELMKNKTLVRPQADPELCTACGDCIDHCPVSALIMTENFPVADADICITCFCCQEICLEKAMTLK
ncbi:MAG: DUF362 domain-containing protein [Deltaproteobacteria bacterium]|nr:DUF362 domain-containing protein [Deltaproteobacteria bacterium]